VTRLRIQAVPGAQQSRVIGRHGNGWKVRLAAPPEDGRANAEPARLLAEVLGIDRRAVTVVAGASARTKLVDIGDVELGVAEGLLDARAGT